MWLTIISGLITLGAGIWTSEAQKSALEAQAQAAKDQADQLSYEGAVAYLQAKKEAKQQAIQAAADSQQNYQTALVLLWVSASLTGIMLLFFGLKRIIKSDKKSK